MKGGYQIIDLKNVNLITDGSAVTIDGVYEHLEGNYAKATLLEGLTVDGDAQTARFVEFTVSGTSFVATVLGKTLTITDDNEITIAS